MFRATGRQDTQQAQRPLPLSDEWRNEMLGTAYQREAHPNLIRGLKTIAAGIHELPPACWAGSTASTVSLIGRWERQRRVQPQTVKWAKSAHGHLHCPHAINSLEAGCQRCWIGHGAASSRRCHTHEEAAAAIAIADVKDLQRDGATCVRRWD